MKNEQTVLSHVRPEKSDELKRKKERKKKRFQGAACKLAPF